MFISTAAINKLQTIPQLVMKFETSHSPDIASKKKKNTNPVQYLQLAHLHSPPRKTSHAENRKKRSVRPLTPRYGNASNKDYQLTYTQNEGLHNLVLVGHVGDHVGHIIFWCSDQRWTEYNSQVFGLHLVQWEQSLNESQNILQKDMNESTPTTYAPGLILLYLLFYFAKTYTLI